MSTISAFCFFFGASDVADTAALAAVVVADAVAAAVVAAAAGVVEAEVVFARFASAAT